MPTEVVDLLAHMNLAQAVSLALMLFGSGAALMLLLANARTLDPRPALRMAAESGWLRPLWQVVVHAGHDTNRLVYGALHRSREAFRDAAALLILVFTSPKGALS